MADVPQWLQNFRQEQAAAAQQALNDSRDKAAATGGSVQQADTSQSDALDSLGQEIANIEAAVGDLATKLQQLADSLVVAFASPTGGGQVGSDNLFDEKPVPVFPWTGDCKWTYNAPPSGEIISGWLPCDGTERRISDFPQLYSVIGKRFGEPSSADNFLLPGTSDLVPLDSEGAWWIRA